MKRKNSKKKLVLWVLAIFLVGVLGLYLTAMAVINYRAEHRLADGIAASKAGDHVKAAELLGRYLHRFPQDKTALSYYVISREKAELPNGQHLSDTLNALKVLLGLEPDRLDDQRHLLELYAKLQRGPEALDTANAILAGLERKKASPDERTLELKTEVLTRLGRQREALETASQWTAAAPNSLHAQKNRLSLQAELGASRQKIIADAQQLLDAHPDDPQFQLLMGFAYAKAGDDKQAGEWLKRAEGHPKQSDEFVQSMVDQYDAIGMSNESIRVLEAHAARGGGPALRHALARRDWQMAKWRQAADCLSDVKPEDPAADATLLALKTVALAKSDQVKESQVCRAALQKRDQPTAIAWNLLLKAMLDGTHLDDPAIVTACKAALRNDSQNAFLLFYYADANARQGEVDIAIPLFYRTMSLDQTWSMPAIRMVECLLQKGRPEQAVSIAQQSFKRNPNDASLLIAMARAWSVGVEAGSVGKADELLDLVTRVQEKLPNEISTRIIRIELLAKQGKKDEATKLLKEALAFDPPGPEQLYLTLGADSRKFDLGVEAECYAACEKAHGLSASLAYARAVDRLAATNNAAEGLKVFDELAARGGTPNTAAWRLNRSRYLDVVNDPGAKAAWITVRDAYPDDVNVQQAIVSARVVQGDWTALHPAIENLHRLTGDTGVAWRLADAKLMLDAPRSEEDFEKASVALHALIGEHPKLAEPRVLLARALVHLNRSDAAVEQLSTASHDDPTNIPIALQLAGLLQSRGDFDRVQQELNKLTPYVHSPGQRRQIASMLTQAGDSDHAMQILEQNPTTRPGNNSAADRQGQMLRAMIHRQRHEYDKAEAILKALLEKPDIAVIQLAASLYIAERNESEATKTLKLLDSMKLEPGAKEMAWGSVFVQSGAPSLATPHYRLATQEAPGNASAWRSLILSELAAGQLDSLSADIESAAKRCAEDKGFAALQAKAAAVRTAAVNPRLRAIVASVLRDPAMAETAFKVLDAVEESHRTLDREHLATQLQQLAEQQPNYLPVQVQLVQCLASMGRVQEAMTVAQRAMAAFPTDAEPAKVAVQVAEATHRWSDMMAAAQAWRHRDTEEGEGADVAIARAKLEQGNYEEAISNLAPYMPAAQDEPNRHFDLIGTYSLALLKAERIDDAQKLLWPLVSKDEPWQILWVQVGGQAIGAAPRAKAWLDRLETLGDGLKPGARIGLAEGYDLLGHGSNDPALIQHAAAIFESLLKDPTASETFILAAAAQAERAGDAALAERLYRRALTRNPRLVIAENNLAVLITSRNGDPAEALKLATDAVSTAPDSATLRDTLATAQMKASDSKGAVASLQNACRLEPDNARWKIRLAKALLDSGERSEATKALQQIDENLSAVGSLAPQTREELKALRDRLRTPKSG